MTNTKLLTIALALACLVAGALLVTHNPVAGGTLLAAGGKLLGLALPEIGKKPAAEADADDTQRIGPLLVLIVAGLALSSEGCRNTGVDWPKVLQCAAPLEQPLLVSVANVLAGDGGIYGDYVEDSNADIVAAGGFSIYIDATHPDAATGSPTLGACAQRGVDRALAA